jgi:hypothetical protein
MTFNVGAFRTAFPEFTDKVKYPDQMVNVWSALALVQVNQNAWGTQYMLGVQLYTAHELVLAAQNVAAAQVGGSPGQQGGIAQTKTIGSVTVGFDAQSSNEKDAAYWNLTTYGKQFIRLTRLFGAGCIQL